MDLLRNVSVFFEVQFVVADSLGDDENGDEGHWTTKCCDGNASKNDGDLEDENAPIGAYHHGLRRNAADLVFAEVIEEEGGEVAQKEAKDDEPVRVQHRGDGLERGLFAFEKSDSSKNKGGVSEAEDSVVNGKESTHENS